MKIIIDAKGRKREIVGPYHICASREDMETLMKRIRDQLADKSWSYGWASIHEEATRYPDVPVEEWD